jgi:hypothetical protein
VSHQRPLEEIDDFTRRKWILALGRLTALAGVSGMVPEFATALASPEKQQKATLPPGLFYPSQEHLSNAFGDVGGMHTIPPGSETEYVRPSSGLSHPQFLTDEELKVITRFIEILLGHVDADGLTQAAAWLDLYLHSAAAVRDAALNIDPLHRALAIAYYGETAVRELETTGPDGAVRCGIANLQRLSTEQYGHGFSSIDESQAVKLVSTISTQRSDAPLRRFYEVVRTEAVRGYYTSAEGLKELDYKGNMYYAVCPACELT